MPDICIPGNDHRETDRMVLDEITPGGEFDWNSSGTLCIPLRTRNVASRPSGPVSITVEGVRPIATPYFALNTNFLWNEQSGLAHSLFDAPHKRSTRDWVFSVVKVWWICVD